MPESATNTRDCDKPCTVTASTTQYQGHMQSRSARLLLYVRPFFFLIFFLLSVLLKVQRHFEFTKQWNFGKTALWNVDI